MCSVSSFLRNPSLASDIFSQVPQRSKNWSPARCAALNRSSARTGPSRCLTPGTWPSDLGPGDGLEEGRRITRHLVGRSSCLCLCGSPRPWAAFWAFLKLPLTCRLTSCFFLNPHLFNHPFENSAMVRRELERVKATFQAQVPPCQGTTVAAGSSWCSWGESGLSSQMPEKGGRHHPAASPRPLTWPRGPAATLSSPGASAAAAPSGRAAAPQRPPGQCRALSALTSQPHSSM